MNNLNFLIRDKPKLEFILKKKYFLIENEEYKDESGLFEYKKVKKLKLIKRRMNWFLTIFSHIFEFIAFDVIGDSYKSIPKFYFIYEGNKKTITLNDCEEESYVELYSKLLNRIEEPYT